MGNFCKSKALKILKTELTGFCLFPVFFFSSCRLLQVLILFLQLFWLPLSKNHALFHLLIHSCISTILGKTHLLLVLRENSSVGVHDSNSAPLLPWLPSHRRSWNLPTLWTWEFLRYLNSRAHKEAEVSESKWLSIWLHCNPVLKCQCIYIYIHVCTRASFFQLTN